MHKPQSDELICVNCGVVGEQQEQEAIPSNGIPHPLEAFYDDDNNELVLEAAPLPLRERLAASANHVQSTTNTNTTTIADSSQALADRMLEGWALLAESCPLCSTPLVRSQEGRIYCVTCQMYAVHEDKVVENTPAAAAAAAAALGDRERKEEDLQQVPVLNNNGISNNYAARNTPPNTNQQQPREEDVNRHLQQASITIAARVATTAAALNAALPGQGAVFLQEIEACVKALREIRLLLDEGHN